MWLQRFSYNQLKMILVRRGPIINHLTDFIPANFILYGDTTSTGLIKDVSFGSVAPHATESRVVYLRMTGGPGPRMVDFSIQSTVSGSDPNKQHHNEILEAATVEGVQPFSSDSHVSYSQPRLDPPGLLSIDRLVDPRGDVCAEASIITTIGVEATCDIFVERIEFVASVSFETMLVFLLLLTLPPGRLPSASTNVITRLLRS